MSEEEEEDKPYWERTGSKSSQRLFLTFIAVVVIMLIIIVSLSIFSYMKWQDLKERPDIKAEEGLFEYVEATGDGKAKVRVHLTLVNQGEEKSEDLQLEWMIMNESEAHDDIFLDKGTTSVSAIPEGESREVTFDITLPRGEYIIAYRTYEDQLFSYEGRQYFRVTQEDTSRDKPEDEKEGAGADTPMLPVTIFIAIVILLAIFRKYNRREDRR